jgi:dihydroxy-acid dehydratase
MTIAGSTNALIHLVAIAGRLGIDLPLSTFDALSRTTPVVADLKPSGRFLMDQFFNAGGLRAVMKQIESLLQADAPTVTGQSVAHSLAGAAIYDANVIRPYDRPISPQGGVFVLNGNLAPRGAVLKQSAASPHLLHHRGRAVVFENNEDLIARIDSPDLPVTEESILVLKNSGPKGAPGMPEWGYLPIPSKLLKAGVRDMIRISDARISGTSSGTIVVHVSPESAAGGPLAIVQDGDEIELNANERRLELHVSDREIQNRLAHWRTPGPAYQRGYGRLFIDHVLQAHEGCDFDFLRGTPDRESSPMRSFRNPAL